MSENRTELMMYQTEDGQTKIDVRMENETVWLSLDQMAELFQRDKSTISRHIRNIFAEGELDREAVVAKFATTASDGKTYQVDFYNLDVIISVGYRVRSLRGTQFRIWANSVLKEYLIKGFAMNDDRLKDTGGKDYSCHLHFSNSDRNYVKNALDRLVELNLLHFNPQEVQHIKDVIDLRNRVHIRLTNGNELSNADFNRDIYNDAVNLLKTVDEQIYQYAVPLYGCGHTIPISREP